MRDRFLATVLLVAATVWVYAAVGGFSFTNYDDNEYVSANEQVLGGWSVGGVEWAFTQSHSSNWHPVTWLSHMTDVELLGQDAGRHHWSNVVVHLLASWLLMWLGWRCTGHFWLSLWVALVFAVHPLHVESVAWISERKDTLSAVFALLTLLAYHRAVLTGRRRWWVGSLLAYALGLMSKPMLVTLPAAMLLFDVWPLRRTDPWRRRWLEKVPYLLLVAGSVPATLAAQRAGLALEAASTISFGQRLGNAVVQWVRYVVDLLWPTDLAVFYPHPALAAMLDGPSAVAVAVSALLLLAITGGTLWLARRWDWRAPAVGWLLYVGMLVPVIGIVQVGQQSHADRYMYLPSIGLLIMAAAGLHWMARRGRTLRIAAATIGTVAVIALLPVSRAQVEVWRNSVSLWSHAVEVTEGNWIAHSNLGSALKARGDNERARRHYEAAVRIKPDYPSAHYNLGNMQVQAGEVEAGMESFRTAVRYDPRHAAAMNNLGNQFARQGRFDEAIEWFERALGVRPDRWVARVNLSSALLASGRSREARPHFEILVRQRPDDVRSRIGLAQVLLDEQDPAALEHARRAVELSNRDTPEALEVYARALGARGQQEEELRFLRMALRLFETRGNEREVARVRAALENMENPR